MVLMKRVFQEYVVAIAVLATLCFVPTLARSESATGQAVITVESPQKTIAPEAVRLNVREGDAHVTSFTPLRGDGAALQLLILIDDSAQRSLALQYKDLKSFIMSLPTTTQVGVAYMQNGSARFAQTYTSDHAAAASALRIPSGTPGSNGSPYFVLSDALKRWSGEQRNGGVALRPGAMRREVLMFTNGVEAYGGGRFNPNNPYVEKAIEDSLRASVIVYAIYVRDIGTGGFAAAEADNGQNYLVQLTETTGGKTYYIGNSTAPNFRPYLDDVKQKLDNQYRLAFTTNLKHRSASVGIRVKAEGAKIYAPQRVYVEQTPR
jgi:hypothetical protein